MQKLSEVKDFENIELLAKQVVEGFIIGLHKSPFHGFSVEFAEHRIYNPGESTKNIDWKVNITLLGEPTPTSSQFACGTTQTQLSNQPEIVSDCSNVKTA